MTTAAAPLVAARNLTKRYGPTIAVDGVDLEIHPGEVFGLLGPNGAGKTTTVLMLLGLSEPDAGSVDVCGLEPTRHPLAVKRHVGYLPDSVGFYEHLTGRENLRYTAQLNELPREECEDRIAHLLDQVGLAESADRRVREYSRGMRQRLGLADALLKDPLVVILDEPMVGIDPEGVIEMEALIARLARDEGRAVLLTSHVLHQVQRLCDRMAIFVAGRIVAEGSSSELARRLSDGYSVFEISANTDESALTAALNGGSDVGGVEVRRIGTASWRIRLPEGEAVRLLPALVEAGVDVREIRDLGSDLDEIYHRYFVATRQEVAS